MTLQRLAELDDWELEDGDQDIRERPLRTPSNLDLGQIKDLMVDVDNERVAAVITDKGESYATEGLEIGEEYVIAHDRPISGGVAAVPAARKGWTARVRRPG